MVVSYIEQNNYFHHMYLYGGMVKERTSLASFLQWPDLIRRNGAAWGWRQGMVRWC